MKETIKVSYVTNRPILGDCPRVEIINGTGVYYVTFYDFDKKKLIFGDRIVGSGHLSAQVQYYVKWQIVVFNEKGDEVFNDVFDLTNRTVFIKMDAFGMGDNIAWFPYIEEFRKKHSCRVICSTFFNELFVDAYPDILFVKPNTDVHNVYAQYYIGANDEKYKPYSKESSKTIPLQKVASNILGLEFNELRPRIAHTKVELKPNLKKYICISEKASSPIKEWKEEGGWQKLVSYLKDMGYDVVVISKEKSELTGVINLSGNIDLKHRINDILHCEFFIGVSSGLSWLSWALGVKTVIISDTTPVWHEPSDNVVRISKNHNRSVVDFESEHQISTIDDVITIIETQIFNK